MRQYHCLTLSTQQSEENMNLHDCDCGTLKLGKPIARGPQLSTEREEPGVSSD